MRIVPTLRDKLVAYDSCTAEDIPLHYNTIKEAVNDVDQTEFLDRMQECVDAGNAYKIVDEDVFIYYIKRTVNKADGIVFYGKSKPILMLTLLAGVFTFDDPDIRLFSFMLHENTTHTDYVSILSKRSLMQHHSKSDPFSIRVDQLKARISRLYVKAGITSYTKK